MNLPVTLYLVSTLIGSVKLTALLSPFLKSGLGSGSDSADSDEVNYQMKADLLDFSLIMMS